VSGHVRMPVRAASGRGEMGALGLQGTQVGGRRHALRRAAGRCKVFTGGSAEPGCCRERCKRLGASRAARLRWCKRWQQHRRQMQGQYRVHSLGFEQPYAHSLLGLE